METVRRRAPRIVELANRIEADIRHRRLQPGDAYLTTAETARMLHSCGTKANEALRMLVKRGVIERKQRRGTFVAQPMAPHQRPPLRRVHVLVHKQYLQTEGVLVDGALLGLQSALPGVQLVFETIPEIDEADYVNHLISQSLRGDGVDGFVLFRASLLAQRTISASGLPAVVYGALYPSIRGLSSVCWDQGMVGRMLSRYLLDQGCGRLAMITRQFVTTGDHQTLEGMRETLTSAGRGVDALTMRCLPADDEAIFDASCQLIELLLTGVEAPQNGESRSIVGQTSSLLKSTRDSKRSRTALGPQKHSSSASGRSGIGLLCRTVLLADGAARAAKSLGLKTPRDVTIAVGSYYRRANDPPRYPFARLTLSAEEQGTHLGRLLGLQARGEMSETEHEIIPVMLEVP